MSKPIKQFFFLSIKQVLKPFIIASIFLTILGIISELLKILDLDSPTAKWFYELFDLDGEWNLPAIYASFSLFFSAVLLSIIAITKQQLRDYYFRKWRLLSFIFIYLGADELLSIHEIFIIPELRDFLRLPANFDYIWVIPFSILVVVFVYKYRKFINHLPQSTKYLFLLAGAIYVGGALGMEFLADIWSILPEDKSFVLKIASAFYNGLIEEILEMIGILVFIYSLLQYIKQLDIDLQINLRFWQ